MKSCPRRVDTNDELDLIETGIRERRVADEDTATSDLATIASVKRLQMQDVTPRILIWSSARRLRATISARDSLYRARRIGCEIGGSLRS